MKVISQDGTKIIDAEEFIMVKIGTGEFEAWHIRDMQNNIHFASYYSLEEAKKVMNDLKIFITKTYLINNKLIDINNFKNSELENLACFVFPLPK